MVIIVIILYIFYTLDNIMVIIVSQCIIIRDYTVIILKSGYHYGNYSIAVYCYS